MRIPEARLSAAQLRALWLWLDAEERGSIPCARFVAFLRLGSDARPACRVASMPAHLVSAYEGAAPDNPRPTPEGKRVFKNAGLVEASALFQMDDRCEAAYKAARAVRCPPAQAPQQPAPAPAAEEASVERPRYELNTISRPHSGGVCARGPDGGRARGLCRWGLRPGLRRAPTYPEPPA